MNEEKPPTAPSARSPFAGCTILIAALLVMVFLIGFSVLTLFRQFGEIEKFTAEKPVSIEVSTLDGGEARLNALAERLEGFRQELAGDKQATLALDAEELNLAIAAYEPFKELRGTFRISEIGDEAMRIAISFPLNGKPRLSREGEDGLVTSDARYLNGTLVARPGLLSREIVLQIDEIEVPGAKVPDEFTGQMSPYRITERYVTDPVLGKAMAKLTKVSLADGKLVLEKVPGEQPADVIGPEKVDAARNRLFTVLGLAACLFLLVAGAIVFIGLRAKRQS
ncbi:MAG: hypothetical protein KDN05_14345 [Verrucomicrobiae bacterium]|nr:hypothetical protein [Verrucomicrobiae bacterium]